MNNNNNKKKWYKNIEILFFLLTLHDLYVFVYHSLYDTYLKTSHNYIFLP